MWTACSLPPIWSRSGASAAMNEIRWQEELLENPYYENREQVYDDLLEFLSMRKAYLDQAWKMEE